MNKVAKTKQTNSQICIDWLDAFPSLSKFSISKFYAAQLCFIHGIELVKDRFSDAYLPHYVMYPLWRNTIEECLSKPFVLLQIKSTRNIQISVLKERHDALFPLVVDATNVSFPFLKAGRVDRLELREFLLHYLSNPMIRTNLGGQADVWELLLMIHLFEGVTTEVSWVLDEIRKKEKEWNNQSFSYWHGDFKTWFTRIEGWTQNPNELAVKISENLNQEKIRRLEIGKSQKTRGGAARTEPTVVK